MSNSLPESPADDSNWDSTQCLGKNYGCLDIVRNFRWTLSKNFNNNTADSLDEVPYIDLVEYQIDEGIIKTQLDFYITAVKNAVASDDPMAPYENLFPKTKPTFNSYRFPYFSETNFEINTPVWSSLDTLEQGAKAAESLAGVLGGKGFAEFVGGTIQAAAAGTGAALAFSYPKVGIMDRPRLWQSHDFRSINIKFPLFNIIDPEDWKKNRSLCWTLINSNLFYKRDFITGIPPVFYEITIPGQHYSYASCVTNLVINNRGNMRKLKDSNGVDAIVPDAYEVNITLTDMVMPSRNLFARSMKPVVTTK